MTYRTIPIIAHEAWAQDICTRCAEPGHCCKRFSLTDAEGYPMRPWDHTEREQMLEAMRAIGLPFLPIERSAQWTAEDGPNAGLTYSSWLWGCPHLDAQGRCTTYDTRPQLCRDYEPLHDRLCAMTPRKERE